MALRQAARQYLDHGLLPVPAWGVRSGGECCCHRGAGCQRPGKHPRSVHVGPGEHDYSWKPLACATREEIEQRFADGGGFATGNLMLAIPGRMLVIDQDNDDGGHQAAAALADQLGELPGTLSHRTPHGVHRIYRTPPGWTPRAWVGKDARNPLPAGIDLRVPGQILMAPPSRVPAGGLLAGYGPAAGSQIADLPAAYVTAWTPPKEPARAPRPAVPVPPGKADAAAAYVHARIAGIAGDLAGREPGGRNTAIYTAALKIGSTLGAARSTPGAENAAAAWSDQAAEDALLAAAERNGYVADHNAAAARSTIRSGLRNGLRSPRPLPDFGSGPVRAARDRQRPRARPQPSTQPQAEARQSPQVVAAGPDPSPTQKARSAQASSRDGPAADHIAAALRAAGFKPSSPGQGPPDGPEGYLVQSSLDRGIEVRHAAIAESINGIPPWDRTDQMLDRYARALGHAGFEVARTGPGSLAVSGPSAHHQARSGQGRGHPEPDDWAVANRAATAANAAYRAGDLDRARKLTDQAADLDPARGGLWQRHLAKIDAKRLFRAATTTRAEGDEAGAHKLIEDAARLDPRMTALWDQDLSMHDHLERANADRLRAIARLGVSNSNMREPDGADRAGQAAGPRPDRLVLRSSAEASGADSVIQAADVSATASEPRARAGSAGQPLQPHADCQRDWPGSSGHRAGTADWRDAIMQQVGEEWQPRVVPHGGEPTVAVESEAAEIGE